MSLIVSFVHTAQFMEFDQDQSGDIGMSFTCKSKIEMYLITINWSSEDMIYNVI